MADPRTNGSRRIDELCGIRTCVPQVSRVLELIRRFAALDTPVLIQGETGTGKELVARALHVLSRRSARPIVAIECAALPESLAESELFGHERGAFTGAERPYSGRIQAAAGGTLFLDEVNSMSLAMQGKLLRFLEQGEVCRVGQQRPVHVDVRLIAASNASLEKLVAAGAMRADFFYRLNVLCIEVPPLRERLDDVPFLVQQFLAEDPIATANKVTAVCDDVLATLRALPWSGNVRELRNVLRRSVALHGEAGMLRGLELPSSTPPAKVVPPVERPSVSHPFRTWMQEAEREYLANLVQRYFSTRQRVAVSGLPERTLYRKLKRLGLGFRWRTDNGGVADAPPARLHGISRPGNGCFRDDGAAPLFTRSS